MTMMMTMANYLPFDVPLFPEQVAVLQTTAVPFFALQKKKKLKQRKLLPLDHRVQMKMLMWMHPHVHYQNHDDDDSVGHPLMMTMLDVLRVVVDPVAAVVGNDRHRNPPLRKNRHLDR